MQLNGLAELVADGKDRVQARHRVLEDDGAALAAEAAHLPGVPCCEILPFVENVSGGDPAGIGQNLHDGIGRHALAGAGLAHDAEHLAGVEIERNAVDGVDFAGIGKEGGVQILHAQKMFTHIDHLFSFGSKASRRPSPSRLRLSTIRQIVSAGNTSLYG